MKYRVVSILIIILTNLSFFIINSNYKNVYIKDDPFLIFIDPGHGGKDGGACVSSFYEKNINLDISLLLKEELCELGYSVLMSRYGDYHLPEGSDYSKIGDLDERLMLIKESNAFIVLSIHANKYENDSVSGCQVFYCSHLKSSLVLASIIQKNVNCELENDRFAKTIDNNYLLRNLDVTSVIIECGFMSNKNDLMNLIDYDYQKKFVSIIASSVNEFFLNY